MATSVTLPALGESVTEGTVTRWLKQPGEEVQVDEPLLEISTDKVDTEIPSPVSGTLLEIKVAEDETVEVGAELAIIGDASEDGGAAAGDDQADAPSAEAAGDDGGDDDEPLLEQRPTENGEQRDEQPAQEEPAQEEPAQQEPAEQEPEPRQEQPDSGRRTPVTLPALGESVTEGSVTRWLKQVGDEVAVDEALLEISTDKVDTEIPSPVAGTVLEIKVAEDETVEVGAELAIIGSGDGAAQAAEQPAPAAEAEQEPAEKEPETEPAETPLEDEAQQRAAAEAQSAQKAETKAPEPQPRAEPRPPAEKAKPAAQRQPAAGDGAPYV